SRDGSRRICNRVITACDLRLSAAVYAITASSPMRIDFPGVRVWVLDDGRRPWLEALCKKKGVNYVTRSTNAHAKAGNINHALDILHHEPDPPEFDRHFSTRSMTRTG